MPVSRLTGSPNSEPLSVNIFSKTDINSYVPRRFSKRSKVSLTAPLVHRLSKKARNSFSFVKNSVRRVLFDSLEEWRYDTFAVDFACFRSIFLAVKSPLSMYVYIERRISSSE